MAAGTYFRRLEMEMAREPKQVVHRLVRSLIEKATCIASLQEVGNLILKLELEGEVVPIFDAWKEAWERMQALRLVDEFEENEYYQLVLNDLREQVESVQAKEAKRLLGFRRACDSLEKLCKR